MAASWRVTEYAASLSQLTLEEHYQEINALLEAVKTAEPGRLPQAWRDLRVLAQVVAERVQEVPWQAAEHFLDAFVGIWGIRGLDGEALAEACLRAGADPGQPSQARLARLCLGQVEEDGPGDPDSAASLMRRLSRESI